MAIQFTVVGEEQYPAIAYTGRLKRDPKGTIRLPYEVAIGGNLYYQEDYGTGRNRYGDYSGLALDPHDHETFWLFNEYPFAINPGTDYDAQLTVGELGSFPMLAATYGPQFNVAGPGALANPDDLLPEMLACAPLETNRRRGVCLFTDKTQNMQDAGSLACLVVTDDREAVNPSGLGDFSIPTLMFASKEDGELVIDALLTSEEPVPLSLSVSPLGPLTYGSDWSTFVGAFKLAKGSSTKNAPQTANLLPQPSGRPSATKQVTLTAIPRTRITAFSSEQAHAHLLHRSAAGKVTTSTLPVAKHTTNK